jgi:hypothetical protein
MRGKKGLGGDDAASARPFSDAGRFAPSASEEVATPTFPEASGAALVDGVDAQELFRST